MMIVTSLPEPHYHSLMYVETFLSVMMLVDINLTLIVCIYYSQGRLDRDISGGGGGGWGMTRRGE